MREEKTENTRPRFTIRARSESEAENVQTSVERKEGVKGANTREKETEYIQALPSEMTSLPRP